MSSNPEILFFSEVADFTLTQEEKVRSWLKHVISSENKRFSFINFIFLSDDALLQKNKEYLQHDYYTDVISFQLESEPIEGDIFISIDRVKHNAQSFSSEFETELHRVIVHGLLHFVGYADKTEEDKTLMREKENHYLTEFLTS